MKAGSAGRSVELDRGSRFGFSAAGQSFRQHVKCAGQSPWVIALPWPGQRPVHSLMERPAPVINQPVQRNQHMRAAGLENGPTGLFGTASP